MKDLYRCLDEYPPELLQAIAEAWHVTLAKGEPHEMVMQLAAAMLTPGALGEVVAALSPDARELLGEFLKEDGVLPGHRPAVHYGSLRRLGPARMAREQPWRTPAGALEELYYRGLVCRAYGTLGDYYGEILLVPQQVLEGLQGLQMETVPLHLEEAPSPATTRREGLTFAEDLFAILARIRQTQMRAARPEKGGLMPTAVWEELNLAGRLAGELHPERLGLLWQLLWQLGLVHLGRGILRPSLRAREWLRLSDMRRAQTVLVAWRDNPAWDELRFLPGLRFEETGWQDNPVAARRALLQVLLPVQRDRWLTLVSFIEALKGRRPDYLRPDGDYHSWSIRDAQTGEYLDGLKAWDHIEGALARYLMTGPLCWLGVVETGEDGGRTLFRLPAEGACLLSEEGVVEGDESAKTRVPAVIRDDFTVTLPLPGTMYERYQLERFAEWQVQGSEATYRVTAESIWRSQNEGIKVEQILHFLRRISQDQVAPAVMRGLQAWGSKFGRVILRKTVLLRTVDPRTMEQLRAQPEVRALLGEVLSPTLCLIDEKNVVELTRRLKALGIWPHVRV